MDHVIIFSVDLGVHEAESQLLQYIKSKQLSISGTLKRMFARNLRKNFMSCLFVLILYSAVGSTTKIIKSILPFKTQTKEGMS
jgi:formate/nitrite transporter FocA (FNT family)